MEYKRSQNKELCVKEMVNVSFSLRKLIQDPNYNTKNMTLGLLFFSICEALLLILAVPMTFSVFKAPSPSGIAFASVVYGFTLIYTLLVVLLLCMYFSRTKAWMNSKEEEKRFDCDDEGVTFIASNQETKAYWKSIQAIRVFKYCMVIIPKDSKTITILAPIENLEGLKAFIDEKKIDIPIIQKET